MFLLEVLSGPLDGKTWSFQHEIVIGRDEEVAEACISLDRYVSRRHAKLQAAADRLLLTDLSSRNGTRLNDRPVSGDAALEIGVPFQVGHTVLRVTRA